MIGLLGILMWLGMMSQPNPSLQDTSPFVITTTSPLPNGIVGLPYQTAYSADSRIDLPAHKTESTGQVWQCDKNTSICVDKVGDTSIWDCDFDKDRILIGPNGNGKWYCHLPQE